MQDAALVAEQGNRDGNDSENDRIHPDQRIENEIRTQTAEPSVAQRRRFPSRVEPGSERQPPHPVPPRCPSRICVFKDGTTLLDAHAEQPHRLSYNVYRTGNNHHYPAAAECSRQFESGSHVRGFVNLGRGAGRGLRESLPAWPIVDCRRGWRSPAPPAETESPPSRAIALSRIAPNTKVSRRSAIARSKASTAAPTLPPDCAPRRRRIRASCQWRASTWKRPGQWVSRIPRSIDSGVTGKPCWLSSSAAAIASATFLQLMASEQRRFHQNLLAHDLQRIAGHSGSRAAQAARYSLLPGHHRWHIGHGAHRPRSQLQNRVSDHVVGLRLLRQRHHHTAGADDSRLLARDLSHRVAQKLLVIERNVGNAR